MDEAPFHVETVEQDGNVTIISCSPKPDGTKQDFQKWATSVVDSIIAEAEKNPDAYLIPEDLDLSNVEPL